MEPTLGSPHPGAPARITFMQFPSTDDPMLLAWVRFRELLLPNPDHSGAPVLPALHPRPGLWRLLAPNNRELARSFLLYSRFDAARAHIEQLQHGAESLTISHLPGPGKSVLGWVILADGKPVMSSSRWYDSRSTGMAAAVGALSAFRTAQLTPAPERSGGSGRLRRRMSPLTDVLQ